MTYRVVLFLICSVSKCGVERESETHSCCASSTQTPLPPSSQLSRVLKEIKHMTPLMYESLSLLPQSYFFSCPFSVISPAPYSVSRTYEFQMCVFTQHPPLLPRSVQLHKSFLFSFSSPLRVLFCSSIPAVCCIRSLPSLQKTVYTLFMLFKPLRGDSLFRASTSQSQITKYIFGSEIDSHKLYFSITKALPALSSSSPSSSSFLPLPFGYIVLSFSEMASWGPE